MWIFREEQGGTAEEARQTDGQTGLTVLRPSSIFLMPITRITHVTRLDMPRWLVLRRFTKVLRSHRSIRFGCDVRGRETEGAGRAERSDRSGL